MKNINCIIISGILAFSVACSKNSTMNNDPNNGSSVTENNFSSSEEAVNKGRADLIALVKSSREFNLGLDLAALERSAPGKPVAESMIDFQRLLTYQNDSISSLLTESRKVSTPLISDRNVVTIIGTSQTDKGWQLGELGNKELSTDLNELKGRSSLDSVQISRIEVPNLQATIYQVSVNNQKQYYTKYGGRSLREAVNPSELLKQLNADAVRFDREFGEELKKNKLVK